MIPPDPDCTIIHRTPLNEWLRSEGLVAERELAGTGKNLPDWVQDRILKLRPGARGEPVDSKVASVWVVPADVREKVQSSRMTVRGPHPKALSRVARNLPAVVHQVRSGKAFVGHHRTTLILGENRYFEHVSSTASSWIAPLLANAPTALCVDGTVAVLYANGAHMFSHWMFDLLPKIELLRRVGWNENNVDFFIINPAPAKFRSETLRLLGIPEHKVLMCEGLLVEADMLLFPSRIRTGFKTPRWVREFVRAGLGPAEPHRSKEKLRLYISRASARGRRLENEDAIRNVLERRGYRTVYAENQSVKDFATLVASSGAIAAPHGAGVANVVFAPAGIQVLEMYGAHLIQEGWLLTMESGGQHFLLPGKDHERRYPWQSTEYAAMPYQKRNTADYYVEPSDLARALDLMDRQAI